MQNEVYLISSFNSQNHRFCFLDEKKSNIEDLKRVRTFSIPLLLEMKFVETQNTLRLYTYLRLTPFAEY